MESKKHICNKICINTFEDFLKSAIEYRKKLSTNTVSTGITKLLTS